MRRFSKITCLMLKVIDKVLTFSILSVMIIFIAYGIYTAFYDSGISNEAFLSEKTYKFSPENTEGDNNASLSDLVKINEDVRGWLVVDGTNINYPVLQGTTDFEYLSTDVYGEFALSGSIFLSCANSYDFSDEYNLIYGHHMENGAMFGDLEKFFDEDFFNAHNTGRLYVMKDGSEVLYKIKFFNVLSTDAYDKYVFNTSSDIPISERMSYFMSQSSENSGSSDESGRIVSLVTCADSTTNGRTVLVGYIEE